MQPCARALPRKCGATGKEQNIGLAKRSLHVTRKRSGNHGLAKRSAAAPRARSAAGGVGTPAQKERLQAGLPPDCVPMRETAIKPAHDPQDEPVCMAATLTACWLLLAIVVHLGQPGQCSISNKCAETFARGDSILLLSAQPKRSYHYR